MSLTVLRPLAFGEVLDHAFGLFRRNFGPLLVISVVCSGLPSLLSVAVEAQGGVLVAPGLYIVVILLSVVGGAIASGASTFVVSEQYLGRDLEAGDALRRAWPKVWTIIVTSVGVSLLTGIGLILLVVPGVIAFAGLSLAVTAVAVEGATADEARSRSWELTKGFKGRMLGLLIIYGLIAGIAIGAVGITTGILWAVVGSGDGIEAATSGAGVLGAALGALLMLAINPLMYCILVVAYYDLRVRKEAFDLDLLATTLEHGAMPRG
jgi:hypothetical protein